MSSKAWVAISVVVIIVLLAFFATSFMEFRREVDSRDKCIENGYPNMIKTSGLKYHCTKVENGTSIIVPLEFLP